MPFVNLLEALVDGVDKYFEPFVDLLKTPFDLLSADVAQVDKVFKPLL